MARRPYSTARFALRRPHDPDYAAFGLFPQSAKLFLDVGANAGMSALSFRLYQRRAPIVSVEPNSFHEPYLRWSGRLARRHRFVLKAAGAQAGKLTLYVPVYRGTPITAEASTVPGFVERSTNLEEMLGERMRSRDFEIVTQEVDVIPLDELGLDPGFVKLDVQGAELDALRGLAETMRVSRPPTMIETPDQETQDFMRSLDYEPAVFELAGNALLSVDASRPYLNLIFLPPQFHHLIQRRGQFGARSGVARG